MIDQVIAAPPKLEPPADFQEWQIDTTFLIEPFLAEFKHPRAEFAGELARSWDRQPPDAALVAEARRSASRSRGVRALDLRQERGGYRGKAAGRRAGLLGHRCEVGVLGG